MNRTHCLGRCSAGDGISRKAKLASGERCKHGAHTCPPVAGGRDIAFGGGVFSDKAAEGAGIEMPTASNCSADGRDEDGQIWVPYRSDTDGPVTWVGVERIAALPLSNILKNENRCGAAACVAPEARAETSLGSQG